jgi:hypothetical protein
MKFAPRLVAALAAVLCVASIAAGQPPGSTGTLQAAVPYPAGPYPWSVAVGDFDGDAVADLAVANLGSGVSVLPGNGDGTFRAPVHSPAGYYPWSVAVGDFNGDHRDDLVVGHAYDYISVLLGNGDGTFGAPAHYPGGSSVAVGDFDGDGSPDLAMAAVAGRVGVLLGNGDGTFRDGGLFGPGTYPSAIVVADFNGDAKADLGVTTTNGGGRTHVLLGFGDGTFGAPIPLAGTGGTSSAVGDFNGDGTADLAVAGTSRADVGVFLGNGDGSFQAEARYGPDVRGRSVAAGDLNADGRDDLIAVTYEYNGKTGLLQYGEVAVLLATGNGAFLPAVHYAAGTNPQALAVGDFDRDGATDVAVANSGSFDVSVLLNGPVTLTTTMHVANMRAHAQPGVDGASWQAQVLVRVDRAGHRALPGTIVSGTWDDGSVSTCVTNLKGTCVVMRFGIPAGVPAVTFTVTELTNPTHPEHDYDPAANHDPDGDSTGTSIVIMKP